MEEFENLARALGADAGNLSEVGDRRPLDLLQSSEMHQQRALAGGADTWNFLQAGLADVLLAQLAMRADHEAMRLVAHSLDEIQHGIARLELDRLAIRHEQGFTPGVALGAFGDGKQRHLRQPEAFEYLADGIELAAAAVDDDEVGPLRKRIVIRLRLRIALRRREQPLETPLQDLARHSV